MGHKADNSFFEKKRAWSKRKDVILGYYLAAYLAKVRRLGRPVLLVDGFAGPGRYGDGEPGSPMVICRRAAAAVNRSAEPPVHVWCVERQPELVEQLKQNVRFSFAEVKVGEFSAHIEEIRYLARTHTVFLYVDPYTASDIDWNELDGVAKQIQQANASVELLMNFNTPSFVRWGLAALKRQTPDADNDTEDGEEEDAAVEPPGHERLTRVVGGTWWSDVIGQNRSFADLVSEVATKIGDGLRKRYSEVCWVPIKHRLGHTVPKYHMFFGSRHPDALELMNDAMIKARGHSDFQVDLFAENDVDEMALRLASDWLPRRQLMLRVVREAFCQYYWKDIRGRIQSLLESRRLESDTGKLRINDHTRLRRVQPDA